MIEFSDRQKKIMDILAKHEPITAEQIADLLGVSKGTIRSDLAVLVMTGKLEAKPKVGYFLAKEARSTKTIEVFKKRKVKDVQGVAITVNGSTTVNDAVITLFLEDVGSLIVVDEDHSLQGIVSRKDLLKVTLGNAQATTMPIQMLMTRQPKIYTATPEESVWEAARKLIYYEIDSLPVIKKVEENDTVTMKVVGRITKTNIIKALLDLENEEI